ncbi:hypothetical protein MMC18_003098 [Xylographa bjoerkii]|nr:hypothetical protein [Xylographa bjoerkii]
MSSIGAAPVGTTPKPTKFQVSHCLPLPEIDEYGITAEPSDEKCCGILNTFHEDAVVQASESECQIEDYEQSSKHSKVGTDKNTRRIQDSQHLCSNDAAKAYDETQSEPDTEPAVDQKEEGLRINLAEDPQPSHCDRLDAQPGLEPVDDQPGLELVVSSRSADWHPKLADSPVRDFLVQIQEQKDITNTVTKTNQDDGLIPTLFDNTKLPEVTSEAGTSSDLAKNTVRLYSIKRRMMSIMLSIALSIVILPFLLDLLFWLLQDLAAKKKAAIGLGILKFSISRLCGYYNGKGFDFLEEFNWICQFGMTFLAI